jgi:hypothetical protein
MRRHFLQGSWPNALPTHDLTIENIAGTSNFQAVALKSMSDRFAIYPGAINEYQDPLRVNLDTHF